MSVMSAFMMHAVAGGRSLDAFSLIAIAYAGERFATNRIARSRCTPAVPSSPTG